MDFDVPATDAALADAVGRHARDVLAPRAARIDATGDFPADNVRELAALGVLGVNIPAEYGGVGASALGIALVMENMASGCAATASAIGAHFLATDAILIGRGTEAADDPALTCRLPGLEHRQEHAVDLRPGTGDVALRIGRTRSVEVETAGARETWRRIIGDSAGRDVVVPGCRFIRACRDGQRRVREIRRIERVVAGRKARRDDSRHDERRDEKPQ